MNALLVIALVLLPLVIAAATRAVVRWVASDGGARPPRTQRNGEWSVGLPSGPYALR